MDWTHMIGRLRPVEADAVRVLTVVHDLGERAAEARHGRIDTESRLQHLDHLVRHPVDLAYVLMDQVRLRRSALASRREDLALQTRLLLGSPHPPGHHPLLRRSFDPGCWERWDDVFAYLGCRDLLRVEPLPGNHLRYRLTGRGARWLQGSVYSAPYREHCALLRDVLPDRLLRSRGDGTLGVYLQEVGRRLETYRREEQIRPEDDLLGRLFRTTFREPL